MLIETVVYPMESTQKEKPRQSIEKGEWLVDLKEGSTFGDVIKHGLEDGIIYMVLPKRAGWRPMDKGMMLSHQTYAKHVDGFLKENDTPRRIAVVNVNTGEWKQVWETHQKWRLDE